MTLISRRFGSAAAITLVAALAFGCQSQKREAAPEPTPVANPDDGEPAMVDTMAGSDTDRAAAAIDRNAREQRGKRRPEAPPLPAPVNQPRVRP